MRHDARYFTTVAEVEEWIDATPWALVPVLTVQPAAGDVVTGRLGRRACLVSFGLMLLAADAGGDVLEQARAAAFEVGVQSAPAPRQLSLERMMTGLGLAIVGGRLVWYRFEDKDCREGRGPAACSS